MEKFSHSTAPLRQVKGIQFGIMDPDYLRRYSVAKIDSAIGYEGGKPKAGGLSDPRLGTMDRAAKCTTDGAGVQDSPGYFGHIELAKPVYHIGFLTTVVKVLRCVSYHSSKILLDKEDAKYKQARRVRNREQRLRAFLNLCGGKRLDEESGGLQPAYRVDGLGIRAEFPKPKGDDDMDLGDNIERKQEITAEKAHEILKRISDEDCEALGFDIRYSRPDWMVLTVLPVPPPPVRPSVMMDASARSEDDLTHKLTDIIKANNRLRKQEENGAPQHIIKEYTQLLQFHVTTFMDNTKPGIPVAQQRGGRPIKSISQRLKGKEGRVRGNLMGKRVDFSARTVISGDPNISIDELGVPWSIALNMTYPETVTTHNYQRLQELVENGPHPPVGKTGAKYIMRDDGQRLDLRYLRKDSDRHLEFGYKVERHLQNGDIVLFNRQPSLHKMSMMGHRVRILPYSTFRLNLSVTSPYNADFDGDEMNMHVPQTPETRAETQEIMMVPRNIVSPQANKPVIGIVQDTLLGCRLMTKRDTFVEKDVFMNILMWLEDWDGVVPLPAIIKPRPLWTGKQIINLILPRKVNVRRKSAWYAKTGELPDMSPEDAQVLIQDGELVMGCLCKKTLGASGGSLIHVIWMEEGPEAARAFLSQCQYVVNYWLLQHGFSIGIGDTVADVKTMMIISETIQKAKQEVKKLTEKLQARELEAQPGMTMLETFESNVNQVLNKARDDAGTSAQNSLLATNNVVRMVTAGSKGSFINISQMIACVGQQNVEGKRIPFGFSGRTLPHFTKDDLGPESRGFVENSYLRGLTPQELFFHAMGGREGLIDTAIKTASTGYIQRRLVKAMEDLTIKYDGTVRGAGGNIVQFLYGEDGMDATCIEEQTLDFLRMKERDFKAMFFYDFDDDGFQPDYLEADMLELIRASVEARQVLDAEFQQVASDVRILRTEVLRNGKQNCPLPVNLKRLIWNAQKLFHCKPHRPGATGLSPMEVVYKVKGLSERLNVVKGKDALSEEAQRNATILFMSLLRSTLASKRAIAEFKLTPNAFDWVVGEIEGRFNAAMAMPGEMIGTVAAQSIGEPTTQMTLNTFHFAGVSAKNVTLGVPRLTEIINIAKSIKTPSLTVFLLGDAAKDREAAKNVQCALEHTTLRKVTEATEIYYDPDPKETVVEEDQEFVRDYYEMPDDAIDVNRLSPWLLRIVLDRAMLLDKKLSVADVAERINNEFEDELSCIFNDDNALQQVLRIRMVEDESEKGERTSEGDQDFLKKIEQTMLSQVVLQGVPGVRKVFLRDAKSTFPDASPSSDGYRDHNEWVLDTEGTNLLEVMCQPDVDFTRTTSNHLIDILNVLGIEAARKALMQEIRNVIEFDGSYVNYRHLAALVDSMTCRGHFMAITRHGINRNENGPLGQCSFEETVDILFRASMFAEKDHMTSVSENIMLGQLAPLGTGCFSLLLDDDKLEDAIEVQLGAAYDPFNLAGSSTPGRMTPGRSPRATPSHMSPSAFMSPGGIHSPLVDNITWSPGAALFSPGPQSPGFSPQSPGYSPQSPGFSPTSPGYSPTSPSYSPSSPSYSPSSPGYSPSSPSFSPTSPAYSPTSPAYSPVSPAFSPTSPSYSPTSPAFSPQSPAYSPQSPAFSPTSPAFSPTSPAYSPSSPQFSPTSPQFSPTSPAFSPTSPAYSPQSPHFSPTSPVYSPTSPQFSPTSPQFSPTSPAYSPQSPAYSPSTTPAGGSGTTAQGAPSPPSGNKEYSPTQAMEYSPTQANTTGYSPTILDNPKSPDKE